MKNVKLKFIMKCLLASLPFLLFIAYVFIFPINFLTIEYPMWSWQMDITNGEVQPDVKPNTIILGDSRAQAGLRPSVLSSKGDCYNFALTGASSIEMYHGLKTYLESYGSEGTPEKIIIMLAPFHYMFTDNFWERTVYFDYLKLPDALELFKRAHAFQEKSVLSDKKNVWMEYLRYQLRVPSKYLPALLNAGVVGRRTENQEKYREVAAERGYSLIGTMDGCDWPNFESNYEHFQSSNMLDEYFRELLQLCHKYSIEVMIEQAPMNETSSDLLKEDFVNEYRIYMEGIQAEFPSVTVETEIYRYDNAYFGDESHLNEKGAEKFSAYIREKYFDGED